MRNLNLCRLLRAILTFTVDFLADTTYPPVLDGSVTTIDVEQRVGQDRGTANQQDTSKDSTDTTARHLRTTTSTSVAATGLHLSETSHGLLLPVVLSRHD